MFTGYDLAFDPWPHWTLKLTPELPIETSNPLSRQGSILVAALFTFPAGSCGNLSAGVGLFALAEGFLPRSRGAGRSDSQAPSACISQNGL